MDVRVLINQQIRIVFNYACGVLRPCMRLETGKVRSRSETRSKNQEKEEENTPGANEISGKKKHESARALTSRNQASETGSTRQEGTQSHACTCRLGQSKGSKPVPLGHAGPSAAGRRCPLVLAPQRISSCEQVNRTSYPSITNATGHAIWLGASSGLVPPKMLPRVAPPRLLLGLVWCLGQE